MTSTMAEKSQVPCEVTDLKLAPLGKSQIEWADRDMPVLAQIRDRFEKEKPLKHFTNDQKRSRSIYIPPAGWHPYRGQ